MSGHLQNGSSQSVQPFAMSSEADARVREIIEKYPRRKSAIMPALFIVQEEHGWLPDQAYHWVAERVGVSPAHVRAVATFYTMYYKKPVGTYHIQVCRTLSCMLCGAKKITEAVKERLQLSPGEISEDGMWSYEEVECLGSCGTAPMIEINDVFFENLTVDSLNALMDEIESKKPDLRYSTLGGKLGGGLPEHPRSCVWKGRE